jgi:hypothetical protein
MKYSWIGLHGHHSALLAAIEDLHYTISLAYRLAVKYAYIAVSVSRGLLSIREAVAHKGIAPCSHNRLWRIQSGEGRLASSHV